MIKILILFFWFLFFNKIFLFWLWLWQLKEYHIKRFLAHFETQRIRKILAGFFWLKFPKFTKKIILISLSGFFGEILFLFIIKSFSEITFYFLLVFSLFFAPLFASILILIFKIPTIFWQKRILKLAQKKREKFKNLIVIGIAGSYGKTSTKEFLAQILSEKFKVLKTPKHINAEVGIAKLILEKLKADHQIFVCEIGAYEKGKITEVCQMIKPKIGILTGLCEQHLSTFRTFKNIILGEGFELIENLPENGIAILNTNNEVIRNEKLKIKNYNPKLKIVRAISLKEKADFWAKNIKVEREKLYFEVFSKDGERAEFKVNLLGSHNIENILLATASAKELGMSLFEISLACQKLKPLDGALKLIKVKEGLNILDATYSANPQGVLAHLEYLKIWPGKKIIIMPCLIELGKASKEIHKKIGEKIGKVCDFAIITTKDYFKEIKEGALKVDFEKIFLIEKPKKILEKLEKEITEKTIILLESRVPKIILKILKRGNRKNNI